MTTDKFIKAILEHLMTGRPVFKKHEKGNACLLENKLQASVWVREPDNDNEYDDGTIYVEFVITDGEVILIFNTHEHEAGINRLPN